MKYIVDLRQVDPLVWVASVEHGNAVLLRNYTGTLREVTAAIASALAERALYPYGRPCR